RNGRQFEDLLRAEHLTDGLGLDIDRDGASGLHFHNSLVLADLEFEIQPYLHADGNGGLLPDGAKPWCFDAYFINAGLQIRKRKHAYVVGVLRPFGAGCKELDSQLGSRNGSPGRIRNGSDNLPRFCLWEGIERAESEQYE